MIKLVLHSFIICIIVSFIGCEKRSVSVDATSSNDKDGLRIAYINSDSILMNFEEFKNESVALEERKKKAEEDLMKKGAALEREFMTYQQQAQKGTLTGKEMEARERYLSGRQESLLAERDEVAKSIMEETSVINERLQKAVQDILKDIKEKEGYDFIMSYIAGGPILVADEKYDITERVLRELNKGGAGNDTEQDTSAN